MEHVRLAVSGRFGFALTNGHDGIVAVFRSLNPIAPWLKSRPRLIRSIHLENAVPIEMTDTKVDRTGAQLNLDGAVVKVEKREACVGSEVNGCRSQFHFGPPIAISPQPVASSHRTVHNRFDPLPFTGWLK